MINRDMILFRYRYTNYIINYIIRTGELEVKTLKNQKKKAIAKRDDFVYNDKTCAVRDRS